MKIRTDFVTNSSSSNFLLEISIETVDGYLCYFEAQGGSGETGRIDYFDGDAIVTVSPKQLGCAKTIDELIKLLEDGVVDEYGGDRTKIFDKSRPRKSDMDLYPDETDKTYDAFYLIEDIRRYIHSMDQIEEICIKGDESNYICYNRTFTYNLKTKEYTGTVQGTEFEKDGSSGGDLRFSDLDSCEIIYYE